MILLFLLLNTNVKAKEVFCETFRKNGDNKVCLMTIKTSIDTPNVTVSTQDPIVTDLALSGNVKIFYLPELIDRNFPNLIRYNAIMCSVKELSRKNFKGLSKLQILFLTSNEIKKINKDTFEDLKALQYLDLCELTFIILNSCKNNNNPTIIFTIG